MCVNFSGSYIPDWDPYVSLDGQLFYVEMGQPGGNHSTQALPLPPSLSTFRGDHFSRVSTRRSGRSKFPKILGNRAKDKGSAAEATETSKRFPTSPPCGDVNIKLVVDPAQRFKYGRRTSISEAMLGLATTPFPDGQRIMIAGFSTMSHPDLHQIIKVGDWLKSIEGTDVTMANLDAYLLTIENITEVQIVVQRLSSAGECKYSNVAAIVKSLDVLMPINETEEETRIFSMMYLTMEGTTEQGPEGQDVLFCYPSKTETELYATRGSFLTINSLAQEAFHSAPLTSSVRLGDRPFHVVYKSFNDNNDLLLLAFAAEVLSVQESLLKMEQILHFLELCFRTVPTAFQEVNANQLKDVCKIIERTLLQHGSTDPINFPDSMIEAHYVALPKEAQLRIDDALSEMEAMDYREWNSDPLKSHREFFVIGSALYYNGYLLASHLPVADLIDINAYLRIMGIVKLMENPEMREMIVWREVYLKSCERGLVKDEQIYGIPQGRWFLSIVAKGHLLLVVVLESRYTDQKYQFINPAPFYVEEIQDTVEHLQTGGIENLTATWLSANKRPRCSLKDTSDMGQLPSSEGNKKSDSVLPFLKRRSNSNENLQGSHRSSSVNSRTPSEDSHNKYDDGDSDSDWDGFPESSQKSSSGFDVSEMTETLLKEVGDILPSKLTSGLDNVLFHYVQLDVGEGILMAPTVKIHPVILKAFRTAAHAIHEVLQNTIRFRQQLAQEGSKATGISKSSVAVKEHGMLISASAGGEEEDEASFWVIGRLFLATGRETYLCHRSDVPQNMVEIAYRLQLNAAG